MPVTLNISPGSVRLLTTDGRKVRKWGSMPLPPGLVQDGIIGRPKVVGTVIDALFKSTGIPKSQVIVSLTGLPFIHRILSLPRMETVSQVEAIQRAARKDMLLPPEELYLSAQAIGEKADEAEFFVLGVPRHAVDALLQTLGEAGITPYLVELSPLALARAANRAEAVIVALEPGCFDIVLVAEGMPAIMRTITPKGERATAEDNLQRLAGELAKTVEFYNSNHPQQPLSPTTPLVLAGELAADAAAGTALARTGFPIEPLTPPLELPADLPAALFAANLGLALKKLPAKGADTHYRDINVNIIADKFRKIPKPIKLPHVILSLVVIAGLGLMPYINQLRSEADTEAARLETELSRASQELTKAKQAVDAAKKTEDKIAQLLATTQSVKNEHQSILGRGDYARDLGLITGALPVTSNFTSVDISPEAITVSGEADTSFTVVAYATALEALGEFTEVRIVSLGDGKNGGIVFLVAISK